MRSLLFYLVFFLIELLIAVMISKMKIYLDSNSDNYRKRKVIKSTKLILDILFILLPSVIAGMRYGIGTDYFSYEKMYLKNLYLPFSFSSFNGLSLEFGFYIVCKISSFLINDFHFFLFFVAFLTYGLAFFAFKRYIKRGSYGLMIFIYLLLMLAPSFNIMRQILASSIIFCGFKYIEKRKIIKYLLIVTLATFFHTSALFCLPLYFFSFSSKSFSKTKEIIFIVFLLLLPLFFNYIFDSLNGFSLFSKYTTIYKDQISYQNNLGTILIRMPILLPLFFNWKMLVEYNQNNRFFLLLYVLEFTSLLLGFYMHWAFRIMYYCVYAEIILVPQLIRLKKGKNKMIYTWYFVSYYLLFFTVVYYIWGNDQIFPYVT